MVFVAVSLGTRTLRGHTKKQPRAHGAGLFFSSSQSCDVSFGHILK